MFHYEKEGALCKKKPTYLGFLVQFIDDYIASHGRSPSTHEIANSTGLSLSTFFRYLSHMRENGMINYVGQRNIITHRKRMTSTEINKVPLLGAVSCGNPQFAEGNIAEYVYLPTSLLGKGDFFLLRASGDSMIDAGIDDGDLVLVRHQGHADPGQIVVALIGEDEATIKRFLPEQAKGVIRLHPENSALEDIIVKNCSIQGVAIQVIKAPA